MADWILDKINNFVDNRKDEINSFISVLISKKEESLEEIIAKLDSGTMKKTLRNLTISQIIKVLKAASVNLQDFILSNIKGQATKSLIIYELKYAVIGDEEIAEAQEEVLRVVQRLRESGEI